MGVELGPGGKPVESKRHSPDKKTTPSKLFENNREGQTFFEQLVCEHSKGLKTYLKSVGAGNEAEDFAQEAFLKVAQKISDRSILSDADPLDVKAYLFRTARNVSIDRARAKKARPFEVEQNKAENKSVPSHEQSILDSVVIQSALSNLPPDQREAILLTFFGGLTGPEIAERLRIPKETVRSRIFYAKKAIRRRLQERGE